MATRQDVSKTEHFPNMSLKMSPFGFLFLIPAPKTTCFSCLSSFFHGCLGGSFWLLYFSATTSKKSPRRSVAASARPSSQSSPRDKSEGNREGIGRKKVRRVDFVPPKCGQKRQAVSFVYLRNGRHKKCPKPRNSGSEK